MVQNYRTIQAIVDKIQYKDWRFKVDVRADCFTIQVVFDAPDNVTGELSIQHCRKWIITSHFTDNEIVRTCFMAIEKAEFHEMCEKFLLNGVAIANPHIDVFQLENQIDFTKLDKRDEFIPTS